MPDENPFPDSALLSVLESLRERGAIGEASLTTAITHAEAFVSALPNGCTHVLDLGSGGGLPGLVIAVRRPDLALVLTDRRERRMDLLRLACAQLGLQQRVRVLTTDVVVLGRDPEYAAQFDAVTARAFGDPIWTLRCAAPLLVDGGSAVVSEPPDGDPMNRWPRASVLAAGFSAESVLRGPVRLFTRRPDSAE